MNLIKKSLELKIILALGAVFTVLLAAFTTLDFWLETRGTYRIVFQDLEMLANTVQKSLIKDMKDGKSSDVQEILEMVGTEKGIISVKIFDDGGRVLKSDDRHEVGRVLTGGELGQYRAGKRAYISETENGKVFHVIHPIANAPACYGCHGKDKEINGVLAISYSLQPVQRFISLHLYKMAFLFLTTISVMALLIYLLLKRLVSSPIKGMKAAMAQAEGGDLDVLIPVSSEDEIGSLQQSFNNMIARIKGLYHENTLQQRDLAKKEQELEHQKVLAERRRALELANREAVEKNRYYMEMLSFISHELKNPLVVLKGYTDLMLKGDLGELRREQREALFAMDKNVELLREMISNYLDLSRIERGDLKVERRPLDVVGEVIKPVMDDYSEMLEKASMSIRLEGPGSAVKAEADPSLIRAVVGNLVSNAVKYGWEGSDIIIEVEEGPDGLRLSVFNEGGGIPYDELEKVFERFTRLDNEHTQAQKGSGLGLYIVKQIIQMHGGRVWAESKEGAWAKVSFTLPAAPEAAGHA
ncbi:MAG TPA: ATP-binding protein [Nitrospirota bacterium]|nr:ATP-binding protein [Nitrospirota bacterium]